MDSILSRALIQHVFRYCTAQDNQSLQLTCKLFYNIITTSSSIIQDWCVAMCPLLSHLPPQDTWPTPFTWKWLVNCFNVQVAPSYTGLGFIDRSSQMLIGFHRNGQHEVGIRILKAIPSIGMADFTQEPHDILRMTGINPTTYKYRGLMHAGGNSGTGTITKPIFTYTGNWDTFGKQGHGTCTWDDGVVYQGNWLNDDMHGHGTLTWPNGQQLDDIWEHGVPIGFSLVIGEQIEQAIANNQCTRSVLCSRVPIDTIQHHYLCHSCNRLVCVVCKSKCHQECQVNDTISKFSYVNKCKCHCVA